MTAKGKGEGVRITTRRETKVGKKMLTEEAPGATTFPTFP